jgi:hypothetical protein
MISWPVPSVHTLAEAGASLSWLTRGRHAGHLCGPALLFMAGCTLLQLPTCDTFVPFHRVASSGFMSTMPLTQSEDCLLRLPCSTARVQHNPSFTEMLAAWQAWRPYRHGALLHAFCPPRALGSHGSAQNLCGAHTLLSTMCLCASRSDM